MNTLHFIKEQFKKFTNLPIQFKLILLAFITTLIIPLTKHYIELEDAEQAYLSQYFRLVYNDQPPIYTWFQIALNNLFGKTFFSLILLRAIIYSGTLYQFHLLFKEHITNKTSQLFLFLLLCTIPMFIDLTFRRLSHTSLLLFFTVFSWRYTFKFVKIPNLKNSIYLALGLGLGSLSKYNFIITLLAICIYVLMSSKNIFRSTLYKYLLLIIAISTLIILPHFWEILNNFQFYSEEISNIAKNKVTSEHRFSNILLLNQFISLIIMILKEFGIILILLFINRKNIEITNVRLLLLQLLIIITFVILLKIENINSRWLIPAMIPIFLVNIKWNKNGTVTNLNKYLTYLFVFAIIFQILRSPLEKIINVYDHNRLEYPHVQNYITKNHLKNVIFDNVTTAGIIHQNTKLKTIHLDDFVIMDSIKKIKKDDYTYIINIKEQKKINYTEFKLIDSVIDITRQLDTFYIFKKK